MITLNETKRVITPSMILVLYDNGLIEVSENEKWQKQVRIPQAEINVREAMKLSNGEPVKIIAKLPEVPQTSEARKYYLDNFENIQCIGFYGESFLKQMVGNLLINTFRGKRKFPMRIFQSREDAIKWALTDIN